MLHSSIAPPSHQQSPKISAARVAPEFCLIFYANDSRDACCYDSLNSRNGNGPGIYLSRVFAFLVCAAQIAGKATHQEITAYRTSSPPSFAYQSISVSIVVESTNIRRPSWQLTNHNVANELSTKYSSGWSLSGHLG